MTFPVQVGPSAITINRDDRFLVCQPDGRIFGGVDDGVTTNTLGVGSLPAPDAGSWTAGDFEQADNAVRNAQATSQGMKLAFAKGLKGDERFSSFQARSRNREALEEHMRAWIAAEVPRVTALSTTTAMAAVDERLSYFRQLAIILGAVSLVVGFLLVTTLVTVSVNERVGEIAVMRALGVRRSRIVQQIVLEGLAHGAAGAVSGLCGGAGVRPTASRLRLPSASGL